MRAHRLLRKLATTRHDEAGAAMAEYALVAVGIAVVVALAAAAFGGRVAAMFATF
ncbi:Flp family type IVb pilin [Aeromicrobium sp. Root236]|uniref:Flp family type IVb pilin n=1 Tax=Aeromicrobium sp. Root236 TaxID=1736498 RepID=UPI000AC22ADF|nr:Flp family type IVb pilin [Aeromicrobium sp. Root236]